MICTGWGQNDCSVQGCASLRRSARVDWADCPPVFDEEPADSGLGFGRIVASEKETPHM